MALVEFVKLFFVAVKSVKNTVFNLGISFL